MDRAPIVLTQVNRHRLPPTESKLLSTVQAVVVVGGVKGLKSFGTTYASFAVRRSLDSHIPALLRGTTLASSVPATVGTVFWVGGALALSTFMLNKGSNDILDHFKVEPGSKKSYFLKSLFFAMPLATLGIVGGGGTLSMVALSSLLGMGNRAVGSLTRDTLNQLLAPLMPKLSLGSIPPEQLRDIDQVAAVGAGLGYYFADLMVNGVGYSGAISGGTPSLTSLIQSDWNDKNTSQEDRDQIESGTAPPTTIYSQQHGAIAGVAVLEALDDLLSVAITAGQAHGAGHKVDWTSGPVVAAYRKFKDAAIAQAEGGVPQSGRMTWISEALKESYKGVSGKIYENASMRFTMSYMALGTLFGMSDLLKHKGYTGASEILNTLAQQASSVGELQGIVIDGAHEFRGPSTPRGDGDEELAPGPEPDLELGLELQSFQSPSVETKAFQPFHGRGSPVTIHIPRPGPTLTTSSPDQKGARPFVAGRHPDGAGADNGELGPVLEDLNREIAGKRRQNMLDIESLQLPLSGPHVRFAGPSQTPPELSVVAEPEADYPPPDTTRSTSSP